MSRWDRIKINAVMCVLMVFLCWMGIAAKDRAVQKALDQKCLELRAETH